MIFLNAALKSLVSDHLIRLFDRVCSAVDVAIWMTLLIVAYESVLAIKDDALVIVLV